MKKLLVVLLCMLLIPIFPVLAETAETHENDVRIDLLEEDVSIGDPALPGTLTLSAEHTFSPYPLPAVVLLHGSGPSNRDEAIGQTALFRDLAQLENAGYRIRESRLFDLFPSTAHFESVTCCMAEADPAK